MPYSGARRVGDDDGGGRALNARVSEGRGHEARTPESSRTLWNTPQCLETRRPTGMASVLRRGWSGSGGGAHSDNRHRFSGRVDGTRGAPRSSRSRCSRAQRRAISSAPRREQDPTLSVRLWVHASRMPPQGSHLLDQRTHPRRHGAKVSQHTYGSRGDRMTFQQSRLVIHCAG